MLQQVILVHLHNGVQTSESTLKIKRFKIEIQTWKCQDKKKKKSINFNIEYF